MKIKVLTALTNPPTRERDDFRAEGGLLGFEQGQDALADGIVRALRILGS